MLILIIDLETTGTSKYDLIVEIGVVLLNLETGQIIKVLDTVIHEPGFGEKHKNSIIFDKTTLSFEEVAACKITIEDIRPRLQALMNLYKVTAYNSVFDTMFLELRGFTFTEAPDLMITATYIMQIPTKSFVLRYKWPSFQEIWDYYYPGQGYVESHRAYDDAYHEAIVAFKMYQEKKLKLELEL